MTTNELVMFKETVKYSQNKVWVKPVCDFFRLDVQNQYIKIKKDPILGKLYGKNSTDIDENEKLEGKNTPDLGEVDKNGRILLTKKGFLRWIQIINPNTVLIEMRETFLIYQTLICDYLFGAPEENERASVSHARLHKLEKLYSKIGLEIKRTKSDLNRYLNQHFGQTELKFIEK